MTSILKRFLSLILCILMIASLFPSSLLAEGDLTAEPTIEVTTEPTSDYADEPLSTPSPEPTEDFTAAPPTEEPTPSPTDEPSQEPSLEPSPNAPLLPFTLTQDFLMLVVGATHPLEIIAESELPPILWTSSDSSVAAVSESGVVTAASEGYAVITAAAADGSGISAECHVSVRPAITSLLVTGPARMQVGKAYPLTALDNDQAIPLGLLSWSSSDESVAVVDASGTVTGVSIGSATITAEALDGSGLSYDFPVEIIRATIFIKTNSNEEFSVAVSENNADAPASIAQRSASSEYTLMRLVLKTEGAVPELDEYNPDIIIANRDNRYLVQFTTVEETAAAHEALLRAGYVIFAEPDSMISLSSVTSGTAYTYNSWGASKMNANLASERLAEAVSKSIKVAVIDSGISAHSFIGSKRMTAYDYVDQDYDPSDRHGHGTHVAGTIVDLTQALNVYVVAYRTFDAGGNAYTSNITNAIIDAADDGCKVINLSARGFYSSTNQTLYTNAINYAVSKGAVFVCAAGNDSTNTSYFSPSNITIPGCVVVAAADASDKRCSFSNYGTSVDVTAPGENIVSCNYRGGYTSMSGTSMAAPHIAAASAIIKLRYPDYSPAQVESYLKEISRDLGSAGFDSYFGYGMPDLAPIAGTVQETISIQAPKTTLPVGVGITLTAVVSPMTEELSITWSSSNPYVLTIDQEGYAFAVANGTATVTAETTTGLSASIVITVESLRISATSITLGRDQTAQLVVSGNIESVVWKSSNTSIATVTSAGLVKGKKVGKAQITATVDGVTFTCTVTVSKPIISATKLTLTASGTSSLSVSHTSKKIKWSSSRSSVASVNSSGKITAKKAGKATITATVDGYKLKCTVTVKANEHTYAVSKKPRDYPGGVILAYSKVYYSGSSIYLDSYLVNNTGRKISKINSLYMSIYDYNTDTLLAEKAFKNISVNLSSGKMKKITLKFTGSATKRKGFDLRLNTQYIYSEGYVTLK